MNLDDKYIVNLSGRRDGSSRFGKNKQFANFGAIGVAWIFSKEKMLKTLSFLNFGKLRISYGTTGNDKISDYQYLNRWRILGGSYQGVTGLTPSSLYNPEYRWEQNRKFEVAIDIEMLHNHILVSSSFYRNRSDNQLIQYALPTQTGFLNVIANFPALVQNTGFEFELSSVNIKSSNAKWVTSLNLSIPNNKLLKFPDLANSSYAKDMVIGQPLSTAGGYRFSGIGPSGTYQFEDVNADGVINAKDRVKNVSNREQKFYGGLKNTITYKRFQLDLFVEFRKQRGPNYLYYSLLPAGSPLNQPTYVMNRWQKPGDNSQGQRFTTTPGTSAYTAFDLLKEGSDISYTDASFIRFKNLSVSYSINSKRMKCLGITALRLFFQAQNIATITNYKGADPETQLLFSLPPLKTFTGGIQITF